MHWLKKLSACPRFNEPLSKHTTLGIGGPAQMWVEPRDSRELSKIVRQCALRKLPLLVIGRGSNILFSDRGFKGVVVCLNSPFFTKVKAKAAQVYLGAGASLNKLLKFCQRQGLGGLEFLAGIPASLGGAVVMNAAARGGSIGSLVKSVTVMDKQGRIKRLTKNKLRFTYRKSNLDRYIVLEALLQLKRCASLEIRQNIRSNLAAKKKTQDLTAKSAGCIFKNPECRNFGRSSFPNAVFLEEFLRDPEEFLRKKTTFGAGCRRKSSTKFFIRHPQRCLTAGELIEACGLKRRRFGGAQISAWHANYIVNRHQASSSDMLHLIRLTQRRVREKFGVCLEPEVKIIG